MSDACSIGRRRTTREGLRELDPSLMDELAGPAQYRGLVNVKGFSEDADDMLVWGFVAWSTNPWLAITKSCLPILHKT